MTQAFLSQLQRAQALLQAGRYVEAERLLALLCASHTDAQAWFLLGAARDRLGRPETALAAFEQAARCDPNLLQAHHAQGAVLAQLDRPTEALAVYQQALARHPNDPQLLTHAGIVCERLADHQGALRYYDAALAVDAVYQPALLNRGAALLKAKRADEALENNRRLAEAYPEFAPAHFNLAEAWLALDRYAESLAACDRALALNPNYAKAHADRGLALAVLARFEEAQRAWQRAAAINPQELIGFFEGLSLNPDGSVPALDARVIYVQKWMGRQAEANWAGRAEFVQIFEHLLRTAAHGPSPLTDRALTHQSFFLPIDPATRLQFTQQVARHIQQTAARARAPYTHGSRVHARVRVGYLSPDFREHALTHLARRLFALHDRDRFEVYAYSLHKGDGSPARREMETTCDRFVELTDMDDSTAAQRIYDDSVDILVDLAGYTTFSRTEIMALRPAPVQVNYLGYFDSMGADFIDYCIADRRIAGPEQEAFFAEKLAYLPESSLIYNNRQEIASTPLSRADVGLPEQGVVFCCFNNLLKIEPDIFTVWTRVLKRTPGSVLWLQDAGPTAARHLRVEAQARGIAGQRLIFAPRVPIAQHLARYRLAELFLDTYWCNAITTASDALWAGLPVLTCPGRSIPSRVGASVVTAAGLPEMVVNDLVEYEERAVFLATHSDQLAGVRAKLAKNRAHCTLFDTERFVRHLEAAYEAMWERAAGGAPPSSFSVLRAPSAGL